MQASVASESTVEISWSTLSTPAASSTALIGNTRPSSTSNVQGRTNGPAPQVSCARNLHTKELKATLETDGSYFNRLESASENLIVVVTYAPVVACRTHISTRVHNIAVEILEGVLDLVMIASESIISHHICGLNVGS